MMANILRAVDVRVDRHIEIRDLANTGEIDTLPQVDTKRLGLQIYKINIVNYFFRLLGADRRLL